MSHNTSYDAFVDHINKLYPTAEHLRDDYIEVGDLSVSFRRMSDLEKRYINDLERLKGKSWAPQLMRVIRWNNWIAVVATKQPFEYRSLKQCAEYHLDDDIMKMVTKVVFSELHSLGVAHGRLHHSNIYISEDRESVFINDFTLACTIDEEKTSCDQTIYNCPNTCGILEGGTTTVKSDYWALGVTFYTCIFGEPFHTESNGEYSWMVYKKRDIISDYCNELLKGLLDHDPKTRCICSN